MTKELPPTGTDTSSVLERSGESGGEILNLGVRLTQVQPLQPLSRPHFLLRCTWHSEMLPGFLSWHQMCPLGD